MRSFFLVCLCAFCSIVRAQDTGTVRIGSEPPGARIVIDDIVRRGQVTPAVLTVAPGVHRVRLVLSGFSTYEETVTVEAGATVAVEAQMQRASGRLAFEGLPPGTQVTVGGQPYDPAGRLPVGPVEVVVTIPGEAPLTQTVTVAPDRETAVTFDRRQFRRSRALLALLGPGLVQARDGRRLTGIAMGSLVVGGLGMVAAMTIRADRAASRSTASFAEYEAATTEAEAVAARESITGQTQIQTSSRRIRTGAAVAAGIVYAAAVVDAFARHVRVPALLPTIRTESRVSIRLTGTGAALALHF